MKVSAPIRAAKTSFPVAPGQNSRSRHKPLVITVRQATREDCVRIARLFMISSDGLAEYIWSQIKAPELSLLEIGERRYVREGVTFSYQNCLVAERDGAVVGMIHSYPIAEPDAAERTQPTDPVLAPYAELEDYASLYISSVAIFHEHRRLGIGYRLMQEARRRALTLGLERLSLICFEKNIRAMRWYARLGFQELRRRPIVPHPFLHYREGNAILLACSSDAFQNP